MNKTNNVNVNEVIVAEEIAKRLDGINCFEDTRFIEIKKYIKEYEDEFGVKLDPGQAKAVITAVKNPFCVVTGGPGTGKTTVIRCVAYCIRKLGKSNICYLAPTGKAARRVSEQVHEEAHTIHSYLHLYDETAKPVVQYADVFIIDESSMIDLTIMKYIATNLKGRVILVGDDKQLPAIGEGAVLRDLIRNTCVPYARLTKTFRQSEDSVLFDAICNIKDCILPLPQGEDFKVVNATKNALNQLTQIYAEKIAEYGAENVSVIIPTRKAGEICVNTLNPILKKEVFGENAIDGFQKDDLVMHHKNTRGVANGEVGVVVHASKTQLIANYEGKICEYHLPADEESGLISLAYATTVYKSQGSEYACVIVVMLDEHLKMKTMVTKASFYTAVTRAKKECIVLTNEKVIERAVMLKDEEVKSILSESIYAALERRCRQKGMEFNICSVSE